MRALRVTLVAVAALLFAAGAGTLLALAASTLRAPPSHMRMSVCARSWFRVDRASAALGITPLRVEILDWNDRAVWVRRRRVGAPLKRWAFRTARPGGYVVVFHRGGERALLDLLVVQCTRRLSLGENDRQQAMFRLENLAPGAADEACVRVTYGGNRPARLRLYGATTGSGLASHLLLVVTRGWAARDEFPSCRSFVPDLRNYVALGRGVVYRGTLAGFPDSWASARDDAVNGMRRTWRRGQSHAFKFSVTLPRDAGNAAQGLTAEQSFVWEARPLPTTS